MKPAPTVPEEAERSFVKGVAFLKEAKDAADFDLAVAAFRQALLIAPWWSDAYYNLGIALGAAAQ